MLVAGDAWIDVDDYVESVLVQDANQGFEVGQGSDFLESMLSSCK